MNHWMKWQSDKLCLTSSCYWIYQVYSFDTDTCTCSRSVIVAVVITSRAAMYTCFKTNFTLIKEMKI